MLNLKSLYEKLYTAYGPQHWWPAKTPYEMMVGAILTQNTTWKNVEKALENLGDCLAPECVSEMSADALATAIRSSGYHNQKALRLKTLTAWYEGYGYDIHKVREVTGDILRAQLLGLKGVGPETADSILLYALDKPYFVIDAYTRRLFLRMGYPVPKGYEDFRLWIESEIDRELKVYNEFHALIVKHAKAHCRSKAQCVGCPLAQWCESFICEEK